MPPDFGSFAPGAHGEQVLGLYGLRRTRSTPAAVLFQRLLLQQPAASVRALLRSLGPALHATRTAYIFYLKEFTHKFGLDLPEWAKIGLQNALEIRQNEKSHSNERGEAR